MAISFNISSLCLVGIKSCQDVLDQSLPSGVYRIYPDGMTEITVYCDINDYISGEAWTVRTMCYYKILLQDLLFTGSTVFNTLH